MKKNLLVGLMCPVLALASVATPVLAANPNPTTNSTQDSYVKYDVQESAWEWVVPAEVVLPSAYPYVNTEKNGDVIIRPQTEGDIISFASNNKISISLDSSDNNFHLNKGTNSSILYSVAGTYVGQTVDSSAAVTESTVVMDYSPVDDGNTGKTNTMKFSALASDIKSGAKETGIHQDKLIFKLEIKNRS